MKKYKYNSSFAVRANGSFSVAEVLIEDKIYTFSRKGKGPKIKADQVNTFWDVYLDKVENSNESFENSETENFRGHNSGSTTGEIALTEEQINNFKFYFGK